jgi:hypothetical protein
LLVAGRVADIYSRKIIYLVGLAIICVFNVLSGVVHVGHGIRAPSDYV